MQKIQLIECPRDAMQGWPQWIPTENKIKYLNQLLQVGFDTIDIGSFVSPKAIPQMADTAAVLNQISLQDNHSKLLVIVANTRGAEQAAGFEMVNYLGFPFSISETFQQRNTNSGIAQSFETLKHIQDICLKNNKELVVYISMGFGNPYGDAYDASIVFEWVEKLKLLGVKIISIADTVGVAEPKQVGTIMHHLISSVNDVDFGVHLHSTPANRKEKIEAAWNAGCYRFDGALKGIGGCPMAGNELVGNMDMEWMVHYFSNAGQELNLNKAALEKAVQLSTEIFI